MLRRILKWTAIAVAGLVIFAVLGAVGFGLWLQDQFRRSLPLLDGEVDLAGLSAPVEVERDDLGVPTIRAGNRADLARATGFVHAQDRFFQMDLLRRASAGELAALIGPGLLANDRRVRVHRFRAAALRNLELADPERRPIIDAYSEGVNAGLAALESPPPEYLLLRTKPKPWRPEDTGLVVLAMYLDLQSDLPRRESVRGLLHDLLPAEVAEFLSPPGTEWDAPLLGEPIETPDLPSAEVVDLSRREKAADEDGAPNVAGSNNWAVAGAHTADGGALLANDMHLPIRLPNIWYRASFVWPDAARPGEEHRVTGVTLPGAPTMIAGSNGHVAWGFTNSQGDWSDLVLLENDPREPDVYRTPDGPRRFEVIEERIEAKGAEDETLEVRWTIWGPVIDEDHLGRLRAQRWVAHDPGAVSFDLLRMERARDLDEALEIAATTRIPTQNCVVADSAGRVGWTLMGPIPRRFGHDGSLPRSWADGDVGWDGNLAADEYPRIVDPPSGRIWTANNRVVDGEMLRTIGDGGFANGARARQIRDDLMALEAATPRDLLDVQLDDRALFLERWRDLLLETLTADATADDPRRAELRRVVDEGWTGRASIDSAAYRLVRAFRQYVADDVLASITAPCEKADERFSIWWLEQWEGALWLLLREQPPHLLNPEHNSWNDQILTSVDRLLDYFHDDDDTPLAERTWGERNTARVQHPISLAVPLLSRWLDVPAEPLPGDSGMPRVQGVTFGASERFVVSPGRESEGIFHMPGGQSGHFASPYYTKGHDAWAHGEPTPFLPGETVHRLTLW